MENFEDFDSTTKKAEANAPQVESAQQVFIGDQEKREADSDEACKATTGHGVREHLRLTNELHVAPLTYDADIVAGPPRAKPVVPGGVPGAPASRPDIESIPGVHVGSMNSAMYNDASDMFEKCAKQYVAEQQRNPTKTVDEFGRPIDRWGNRLSESNPGSDAVHSRIAETAPVDKPAAAKSIADKPVAEKPVGDKPQAGAVHDKPAPAKSVDTHVTDKPVTAVAPAKPATNPAKPQDLTTAPVRPRR